MVPTGMMADLVPARERSEQGTLRQVGGSEEGKASERQVQTESPAVLLGDALGCQCNTAITDRRTVSAD